MPQKTTSKKPSSKKKPPKKGTINKAQAIRDSAKEMGKKARPKDIIAALAAKGITVTSPQVSMTLKAAGLRKGSRTKKVVAASRNGKSVALNIEDLTKVKELAVQLGGIERLKETIAVYEELKKIWYAV
jgi:acyl-CoA synthetase (NDP forming)